MRSRKIDTSNRKVQVKPKHRRAARAYYRGERITTSLQIAGYSPKQAKKGWATVWRTPALQSAFDQEQARFEAESKSLPAAEVRARVTRWRLYRNVVEGRDKAVQSAKLLGQDREMGPGLWEPDANVNVNIAEIPTDWLEWFRVDAPATIPAAKDDDGETDDPELPPKLSPAER